MRETAGAIANTLVSRTKVTVGELCSDSPRGLTAVTVKTYQPGSRSLSLIPVLLVVPTGAGCPATHSKDPIFRYRFLLRACIPNELYVSGAAGERGSE